MAQTDPKEQNRSDEEDARQADVAYQRQPNRIADHCADGRRITFRSNNDIELRVTVHTPEIVQLRYVFEGDQPSDFSYAIDPDFNPDIPHFQLKENPTYYQIATDSIQCRIAKKDMQVRFLDHNGSMLCKDKKPFSRRESIMKGITEVQVAHKAPDGTSYFGLGDKACEQNLRGHSFENWNTDAYAYERGDDPLYRSIPFYSVLNEGGHAYGIFLDNTYRSHFDFDSKNNNTCRFAAEGGCMNYYFIYGPALTTVSERYAMLTGTPELPPLWALGYHQSRWSYWPDERVRKLAKTFRQKAIPCDAIYLDIDYMDDYRVFTWDNDRFPDPTKLIHELREQGFETIVMIDPGVKVDPNYSIYQHGLEKGFFCHRPDGELMVAPVWPGATVFPDFTHPVVRRWWGDLYEDLLSDKKVGGIWNDMNEPAIFEVKKKTLPNNVRHHFEGQPASHKKAHNIYGMQMARASYNGIKKHNNANRPFLLTRANFAGGQRYAALWTGDNIASWDHLKLANEQCQRLSISGFSFVGTDIGGFTQKPSAELFTRWLQLGVFHPLFRNHTMGYNVDGAAAIKEDEVAQKKKQNDTDQEPWSFGEKHTKINRSTIELRYRLLHYLYTAFQKNVSNGTPILRPLAFYDQEDAQAVNNNDQFLFGDHILVSPVLHKNKRTVETYFPTGRWYDFRTNDIFEGAGTYRIDAPLAEIPFFIKEGTVLPLREVMQHTRKRDPKQLELNVYYGSSKTNSQLYEDAGDGYEYAEGNYRLTEFRLQPDNQSLMLTADRKGSFTPTYQRVSITFIGLPFKPDTVAVDGSALPFTNRVSKNRNIITVETDPDFNQIKIE
jgi:alpha-glucosidase